MYVVKDVDICSICLKTWSLSHFFVEFQII